jgi:hypothetical protein
MDFLLWIILAGVGGAIAGVVFGNEVRSRLGILPEATPPAAVPPPASSGTPANDEIVALLKDLQASQKRTADQVESALQLLTSEQAMSKATADAMAALSAKVDALQRPAPIARKPAPAAPRKPPVVPRPPVANPEPSESEPPPDGPTPLRPSTGGPNGDR